MLAVLERAVEDWRTYARVPTGRAHRIFMDVQAWFDSAATGPFDFEGICQAVGLEPTFIRKGIRRCERPLQDRPGGSHLSAPLPRSGVRPSTGRRIA